MFDGLTAVGVIGEVPSGVTPAPPVPEAVEETAPLPPPSAVVGAVESESGSVT